MASCAIEACTNPACPVCTVNARFPDPVKCGQDVKGRPCQVIAGHPEGRCRPGRKPHEQDDGSDELQKRDLDNEDRDGETMPAALKGGDHLAFKKRTRIGPHR